MNVLVTGATGFLGRKVALHLASIGYNVTGTGRNQLVGDSLSNSGIQFKACHLENRDDIMMLCENQHFVIHCGALSSPWGKYNEFYQANVIGTKNVIDGCKKWNVSRLVHVSTPSLYFHYDERKDVKEDDSLPEKFVNHYAKTKFLAEKEVDQAFIDGLSTITIRPRALFGPGDQAIFPRLIKVCEKGMFPKVGSGDVVIDMTYIDNAVDAILLCMNSGSETLGQKYNITNGERVQLYSMIDTVMKRLGRSFTYKQISFKKAFHLATSLEYVSKLLLFGKEPLLTRYTVSVLSQSQTLSIEKAKSELGYKPAVSVEDGTKEFIDWWKSHVH